VGPYYKAGFKPIDVLVEEIQTELLPLGQDTLKLAAILQAAL
jgi:hypothetical protein